MKNACSILLAATSCLIALSLVIIISYQTYNLSTPLPFWDHWSFINQLLGKHGHFTLHDLWAQHNEHRLVLPRLFMLADFYWFHATGRLLLSSNLIFQAAEAFVFCSFIYSLREIDLPIRLSLFGLVVVFLFSPGQMDNFVWGFQICFILATFLSCLALYLFTAYARSTKVGSSGSHDSLLFLGCLVSASGSECCLASGILTWPFLVALALYARVRRKYLCVLILFAATMIALYFHGYQRVIIHADPVHSLRNPILLLDYVLVYLGSTWIPFGIGATKVIGLVGLLATLGLTIRAIRIYPMWDSKSAFLGGVTLFCVVTAFVTGAGRINFGVESAFSSRYQTVTGMFWAALAIWIISTAADLRLKLPIFLLAGCAILVVAAVPLFCIGNTLKPFVSRTGQWRAAEAALLSGVDDREMLHALIPNVSDMSDGLAYFRRHRLSLFAQTREQLGTRILSGQQTPSSCPGAIDMVANIFDITRGGYRLSGWVPDPVGEGTFRRLLITDNKKNLIGFGFAGYTFANQASTHSPSGTGWYGYLPKEVSGEKGHAGQTGFQVYEVRDNGSFCLVASRNLPVNDFLSGGQMYSAISDLHDGIFRKGQWWLDTDRDWKWLNGDFLTVLGQDGDLPVVGDWDGVGKIRVGLFRKGQWWLDMDNNWKWEGGKDKVATFGQAGDLPITGDWDGSGRLREGVFRQGKWWLDMNYDWKWETAVDRVFTFGQAGDIPVVGDWDGRGQLRIGVYRKGEWLLDIDGDYDFDKTRDKTISFGRDADFPVVGDWDHSGKLRIGVFSQGHWLLDMNGNLKYDGPEVDRDIVLGQPGDLTSLFMWPLPAKLLAAND